MAGSRYKSKATVTSIKASSRASVKVGDSFYTFEYIEERTVPEDCDMEKERKLLWETAHSEVDKQIQDIFDSRKRK